MMGPIAGGSQLRKVDVARIPERVLPPIKRSKLGVSDVSKSYDALDNLGVKYLRKLSPK